MCFEQLAYIVPMFAASRFKARTDNLKIKRPQVPQHVIHFITRACQRHQVS